MTALLLSLVLGEPAICRASDATSPPGRSLASATGSLERIAFFEQVGAFAPFPTAGSLAASLRLARLSVSVERLDDPNFSVWPDASDPELSAERGALRSRYLEARRAFEAGDSARARTLLTELLESYPVLRPYLLRDLARLELERMGGWSLSSEPARDVLSISKRMLVEPGKVLDGWSHYLRGRALLGLRRPEEAESSLSLALASGSSEDRATIYYFLGQATEMSQRPDDAYTFYRLAEEHGSGAVVSRAKRSAERVSRRLYPLEKFVDWELRFEALEGRVSRRWMKATVLDEIRQAQEECDIEACKGPLSRLEGLSLVKLARLEEAEKVLRGLMKAEAGSGGPRWATIYELQRALGKKGEREARKALLAEFIAGGPRVDGVQAFLILALMEKNDGDFDDAAALYKKAIERFAGTEEGLDAHWRLTWEYIRRGDLVSANHALHQRLTVVPEGSDEEAQARYWLGRMLENSGDLDRATAIYDDVRYRFRNTYYAVMSDWRLNGGWPVVRTTERVAPVTFDEPFPGEEPAELGLSLLFPGFQKYLEGIGPGEPAVQLERVKEFWLMGLEAEARLELLDATKNPAATSRVLWMASALRHALGSMFYGVWYGNQYLRSLPGDEPVPAERMGIVSPMPYREALFRHSLERGIEPGLVGALIQQESTFRPTIRSRAGAVGLMQVMPYTGREVCGWLKIRGFRSRHLREPDLNLRLGTEYLRAMLERHDDSIVRALASYNAGPAAVDRWTSRQGKRLDDDYFAEEIPYAETRDYVRHVIRNFQGYLETYGAWLPHNRRFGLANQTARR